MTPAGVPVRGRRCRTSALEMLEILRMNAYSMSFAGALLERGFWLYVWRVNDEQRTVFYVGRTGDSSSAHASSPYRRASQHLDDKPKAKANALHRCLRAADIEPKRCRFELFGIGPLYPEQASVEQHRPLRDEAAALERAVADHLREQGLTVLGAHPRAARPDAALLREALRLVDECLQGGLERVALGR